MKTLKGKTKSGQEISLLFTEGGTCLSSSKLDKINDSNFHRSKSYPHGGAGWIDYEFGNEIIRKTFTNSVRTRR